MSLTGVKFHEGWPVVRGTGSPKGDHGGGRRWPRRWPWWAWLVLGTVAAIAATASALLTLASDYQPLSYGDTSTRALAYPGLPAGHGIRTVNTFGDVREDWYIPPQRGTFYLYVSITNTGSRPVIIESVSVPKTGELRQAGQTRYARPPEGNGVPIPPPPRHVLHDVTLGHWQEIFVAIPVRSWPCTSSQFGWTYVPSFDVTYRFGIFTHVAALPWGMHDDMLIMHFPAGKPGEPGVFCVR